MKLFYVEEDNSDDVLHLVDADTHEYVGTVNPSDDINAEDLTDYSLIR
jgi:hypothetical protein